ncbi:MAG: hypothetical protein ACLU30_02160 [Odoribacter splanchnicus]
MNLSDNLSEIYYNANTEGRNLMLPFRRMANYGSGIASVGWVTQAAAGLRGEIISR